MGRLEFPDSDTNFQAHRSTATSEKSRQTAPVQYEENDHRRDGFPKLPLLLLQRQLKALDLCMAFGGSLVYLLHISSAGAADAITLPEDEGGDWVLLPLDGPNPRINIMLTDSTVQCMSRNLDLETYRRITPKHISYELHSHC
jgi:hypothetical protein